MAKGPRIPDIATIVQMGINPKTGLPLKFGNRRCTTKEDIKKVIRKNDEQIFVNRYTWTGIPCDLTSQELERMIYYKGQLCFFYFKELDQFFFMPYALDGGLDFYGRYTKIKPLPFNGASDSTEAKAQAKYLGTKSLKVKYGLVMPEDLTEEDLYDNAVLLHDYTKQLSQQVVPTQMLNDPVIDLEAECMPFLRTAMLMGTGTKGVRVADADQYASVLEGARNMIDSALNAEPYVPIEGPIEMQELADGSTVKCADYLQTMQAIDNFRLGLHGVDNGGLFEKKAYVNDAQTGMNYAGGDVGLTLSDGLLIRQNFCNIVNSIWGLGIWCEISENLVNLDMDGDGVAYERNEEGENGGVENGNNNETNV